SPPPVPHVSAPRRARPACAAPRPGRRPSLCPYLAGARWRPRLFLLYWFLPMLNVVILAAGLGKRMQSDLPKVLHTLAGRPMLAHVLDSARQLEPAGIVVVVGHGAERVRAAFEGQPGLEFALQQPQQGTGHAVQQAVPL